MNTTNLYAIDAATASSQEIFDALKASLVRATLARDFPLPSIFHELLGRLPFQKARMLLPEVAAAATHQEMQAFINDCKDKAADFGDSGELRPRLFLVEEDWRDLGPAFSGFAVQTQVKTASKSKRDLVAVRTAALAAVPSRRRHGFHGGRK